MEVTHETAPWKQWFAAPDPKSLLCARQWTRALADAKDALHETFVRYWYISVS